MLTESVRVSSLLALFASLVVSSACVPGDSSRGAQPVVEASGLADEPSPAPSEVPLEALASLDKVFVPISGKSLLSLDDALAEKGYGNVKGSDFRPQFEHADTRLGPAVVAYSSGDWVPSESLFQPMSVTQWLEAALSDTAASGAVINPGHPGQTLALSKKQIGEALTRLPRRGPLPMEVYIAQ